MSVAPFPVWINGKKHLFMPDGRIVVDSWDAVLEARDAKMGEDDVGKQGNLWDGFS